MPRLCQHHLASLAPRQAFLVELKDLIRISTTNTSSYTLFPQLNLNSMHVLSTLPVINTVFRTLIIFGDIKGFGNFRLSIIFQVLSPKVNISTESKYLDPPTLYCPLNPPATSRTYKSKLNFKFKILKYILVIFIGEMTASMKKSWCNHLWEVLYKPIDVILCDPGDRGSIRSLCVVTLPTSENKLFPHVNCTGIPIILFFLCQELKKCYLISIYNLSVR